MSKRLAWGLGWAIALGLIGGLAVEIAVERRWFAALGQVASFDRRLLILLVCGGLSLLLGCVIVGGNLWLAWQWRYGQGTSSPFPVPPVQSPATKTVARTVPTRFREPSRSGTIPGQRRFGGLLLTLLFLQSLLLVLLVVVTQEGVNHWQGGLRLSLAAPDLPNLLSPQPFRTLARTLGIAAGSGPIAWQPWPLLGVVACLGLIFWRPLVSLSVGGGVLVISLGVIVTGQWMHLLPALSGEVFDLRDPLYHQDISFYIFRLPALEVLRFWLDSVLLYSALSVALIYWLSGNSFSDGRFPGFSPPQQRHLGLLLSVGLIYFALRLWLGRYELLYSKLGVVFGAGFTDTHVLLPALSLLALLALGLALGLLVQLGRKAVLSRRWVRLSQSYGVLALLLLAGLPWLVQGLIVQPNELQRELPFLRHNIAGTRAAFSLASVDEETFDPQLNLSQADLQRNRETVQNIRLWDTRPLLQTNRQLQQIRLYYIFPSAAIDRYRLETSYGKALQQVIIAARELDFRAVPQQAQTWINQHLVYTHGYGFTLSPVNVKAPSGLPVYFIKDIGQDTTIQGDAQLGISDAAIRQAIPVERPRIYYGQQAKTYVLTPSRVKELDYPLGNDNVYNVYDGTGGVDMGDYGSRLLFSLYLRDWQMLFSRELTPQTRVLFRREISERVKALAPFLNYDADPYLVSVNLPGQQGNTLYWILDAYTTSGRYPYSDPGDRPFNYIRNSVKAVVNAYNGSVDFYVADPQDPIIRTWQQLLPGLFKPLNAMPEPLRQHLRYPPELFRIQSNQLLTYHVTDPQVFYNRDDQWQIPLEIYGGKTTPVQPYYQIMRLPTAQEEEFILLTPITPQGRNNLVAWLAARSDGANYGRLLLYRFPTQRLVFGTEQIQARINQDPEISRQFTLWSREGSRVIEGNLLVIPIEQSLLYVEPVYLEAERNSLPTLIRVIVSYGNRIVMRESLQEALDTLFSANVTEGPLASPAALGRSPGLRIDQSLSRQ
jgi:uncharacterized membrane protein (UPF0182 family)